MLTMAKDEKKMTTIQISKENADKLAALGKKGDSYDSIITKLLSKKK